MLIHPVMNPIEASELRELSFTPPHKPITQRRIPVNDAVLKLGCLSINKIKKTNYMDNPRHWYILFRS